MRTSGGCFDSQGSEHARKNWWISLVGYSRVGAVLAIKEKGSMGLPGFYEKYRQVAFVEAISDHLGNLLMRERVKDSLG